jgi:hypothetical protein
MSVTGSMTIDAFWFTDDRADLVIKFGPRSHFHVIASECFGTITT